MFIGNIIMIRLSFDQLTFVENRLKYLKETNNGNCMQKVSQAF